MVYVDCSLLISRNSNNACTNLHECLVVMACPLQDPHLGGNTPEEATARAKRAEERRQRIAQDMAAEEGDLPETRWPYVSKRAKVSGCGRLVCLAR